MDRLTKRDEFRNADIIGVDSMDLQCNLEFDEFNRVTNAMNRLAEYEDIGLTPEQLLQVDKMYADRCSEIAGLERKIKKTTNF